MKYVPNEEYGNTSRITMNLLDRITIAERRTNSPNLEERLYFMDAADVLRNRIREELEPREEECRYC